MKKQDFVVIGGLLTLMCCGGGVLSVTDGRGSDAEPVPAVTTTPTGIRDIGGLPVSPTSTSHLEAERIEASRSAETERIKASKSAEAERERLEQEAEDEAEREAEEQRKFLEEQEEYSSGSVYYDNCSEVRAAGADPIRRGDPGYGRHLDRDGDGVGCE